MILHTGELPRADGSAYLQESAVRSANRKVSLNCMERLSAAEIARITHIHPSALKRYLVVPANRTLFGVGDDPPTYPAKNLPLFRRLAELHEAEMVTPKTLSSLWSVLSQAPGPQIEPRTAGTEPVTGPQFDPRSLVPSAQVPTTPESQQAFIAAMQQAFLAALEADRAAHSTPPQDELLTAQEAAGRLKCSPRSIRRVTGVLPVRRGLYRESDILHYIRALQPIPPRVRAARLPVIAPPPADTTSDATPDPHK